VKLVVEFRGLTVPNVVGRAGVLPNRPVLVVLDAPKAPTRHSHLTTT